MFYREYPGTDFNEYNLDWVIRRMREVNAEFSEFKVLNTIKFGGYWDITKQYPAWMIVNDGNNDGYISLQPVPAGVALTNTDYWVMVANYSVLVADLQNMYLELKEEKISEYDSVSDVIADTDLQEDQFVHTAGYYAMNDGGGAVYKIANTAPADEYYITLDNGLYGILVHDTCVNVLQCGMISDGTTSNGALFKRLMELYPELYVPAGNYLIDEYIVASSGCLKLHGDGIDKSIITIDDGAYLSTETAFIKWQDADHLVIKDLTFDGGSQTEAQYMLSMINCEYSMVENVRFTGGYGYALRFTECDNSKYSNLVFESITGVVGNPGGGMFATEVKNCVIEGIRSNNLDDHTIYITGYDASGSHDITISDCVLLNNGTAGLTNGGAIVLYGNVFRITVCNIVTDACRCGIVVSNYSGVAAAAADIVISDCVLNDSVLDGINVIGVSSSVKASNINCNNVTIRNSGEDGLRIENCEWSVFDNFIIDTAVRAGITMATANDHVKVSNFFIKNCTSDGIDMSRNGSSNSQNEIQLIDGLITTCAAGINCRHTLNVLIDSVILQAITAATKIAFTGASTPRCFNVNEVQYAGASPGIIYNSAQPIITFYPQGTLCLNTNAAAGQPFGWILTSGGWKALANIS